MIGLDRLENADDVRRGGSMGESGKAAVGSVDDIGVRIFRNEI